MKHVTSALFIFLSIVCFSCTETEFSTQGDTNTPVTSNPGQSVAPEPIPTVTVTASPSPTSSVSPSPVLQAQAANIPCNVYDLSKLNITQVPDFGTLPVLAVINISNFDAVTESVQYAFQLFPQWLINELPGAYGLSCSFNLNITQAGNYVFSLSSDDGSKLFYNGNNIIDNDGQHAMASVSDTLNLAVGVYQFRLDAFQNDQGSQGLQLLWETPTTQEADVIPASAFVNYE